MSEKAKQGARGTESYPGNQRPTNFGSKIKSLGSRVTRNDMKNMLTKGKGKKKGGKRIKIAEKSSDKPK